MAKNLLYIEALSSIALEHWEVGNDKLDSLSTMQRKALKKEVCRGGSLHVHLARFSSHGMEEKKEFIYNYLPGDIGLSNEYSTGNLLVIVSLTPPPPPK